MIPRGFTEKLRRLGVVKMHLGCTWHADEHVYDVHAFDANGRELPLEPVVEGQVQEAMNATDLTDGTYLWRLDTNDVVPIGGVRYLWGDAQGGEMRFEYGDDDALLLARDWTPEQAEAVAASLARHANAAVRAAVASNPHVPASLKRSLLGDFEGAVVAAAVAFAPLDDRATFEEALRRAEDETTLPRDLAVLARSDFDRVRLAVAKNASASSATLRELAGDGAWRVQLAVRTHPSCPADVRNTLLDRLAQADDVTRLSLADAPSAPQELLTRFLQDPDEFVRARAARHPSTPLDAARSLERDASDVVRDAVEERVRHERAASRPSAFDLARDPHIPLEEQWRVARTPHDDEVRALAENPRVAPEVVAYFASHPGKAWLVAERPDLTAEQMRDMARAASSTTRSFLARNLALPLDVMRHLARDPDVWVRHALAAHPSLPEDVQRLLARDAEPWVRRQVARARTLSAATWASLASDADPLTALDALHNPHVPLDVARVILERDDVELHTYPALDGVRPDLYGLLARRATGHQLRWLAEQPATPSSPVVDALRAHLGRGEDPMNALLEDPSTPPDVLARLVVSAYDAMLARHPNVTRDILGALVRVRDARLDFHNDDRSMGPLVEALLASPLSDEALLAPLATWRAAPSVRARLAADARTPPALLSLLLEDPHPMVVDALRRNPELPPAWRSELDRP